MVLHVNQNDVMLPLNHQLNNNVTLNLVLFVVGNQLPGLNVVNHVMVVKNIVVSFVDAMINQVLYVVMIVVLI
jgi:hypothetical protein